MAPAQPPIPGYEPVFHGGALTRHVAPQRAKLNGETTVQGPVNSKQMPRQLASGPAVVHPESTYKILDNGAWKVPDVVWKESKPLAAQKLAPAEKIKGGWSDAPVDKPVDGDGSRMVVRANPAMLKSKWSASLPPRPAPPPPLPTHTKLSAGMTVALAPSDKENKPSELDLVVATFPILDKKKDAKWRLELKCKGWERGIGVLTETPTASFKIPNASSKSIEVRGAVVDPDGKSSLWTEWRKVPPPAGEAASSSSTSSSSGGGGGGGGGGSSAAAAAAAPAPPPPVVASSSSGGPDVSALEARMAKLEAASDAAAAATAEAEARAQAREAELTARLEEALQRAEAAEAKLSAAATVS